MAKRKDRRRQTIPKDESKSDRFKRVCAPRVAKAVKAIKQIAFCAGSTYESTEEQAKEITDTLTKEVVALGGAFKGKREPTAEFEFKS